MSLVFVLTTLTSCGDDNDAADQPTQTESPATVTPRPELTATEGIDPSATVSGEEIWHDRLLDTFAAMLLQGNSESLTLESLEEVTWQSGCLESLRPEPSCPPASIEGYQATISYRHAVTYILHTDQTLSKVYWVPKYVGRGEVVELTGSGWVIAGEGKLFGDAGDPGKIEVVIVDGTEFYTSKSEIKPGSVVELGVAEFLTSDLAVLVWIK